MRGTTQNSETDAPGSLDGLEAPTDEAFNAESAEPFFGRRRLLASANAWLREPRRRASVMLLAGEAGIGKTRFAEEVAGEAERSGMRVAWGHHYDREESPPYLAFEQIERALGRSQGVFHDAGSASGPRSKNIEKEKWSTAALDPQESRRRYVSGIASRLIEEAQCQPLLLIVEDINAADTGSLLLLNHLADLRQQDLPVLATMRTGEEPQEVPRRKLLLSLERKSWNLALGALERPAIRSLVKWVCGDHVGTDREIEAVTALTGGNPLFIRELLGHLRDEGLLELDTLAQALDEIRVPHRLASVLDLRTEALSLEARRLLGAASVLGLQWDVRAASIAAGVVEARTEDLLAEALEREIVKNAGRADVRTFRFAHPLYARRLHERMRPSQRREAHRRVSEAATSGELQLTAEEAAAHHVAAGVDGERAGVLCVAAADAAEARFAFEVAVRFWSLAAGTVSKRLPRRRAEVLRRLGWACWSARIWGQARAAWEEAASLFEAVGEANVVRELAFAIGETARWQQDLDAAERWLNRALELDPREDALSVRAVALLGSIACARSEPERGLALLTRASRQSAAIASTGAEVDDCLALGYMSLGDIEKARDAARKGLRAVRRTGETRTASLLAGILVQAELSSLKLPAAERYARITRRLVAPEDATGLMFDIVSHCFISGFRGRWRNVISICERHMPDVRLAGEYQLGTLRCLRAEAYMSLGNPRLAAAELSEALPHLEAMRHAGEIHMARAMARMGEDQLALTIMRGYVDRVVKSGRTRSTLAVFGEAAALLGERDACRDAYQLLSGEARPLVLMYSPTATQRVLGTLATALGDYAAAEGHFQAALQQLGQAGALWELAKTYSDYAFMRRERGRKGDDGKALAMEAQAELILSRLRIPSTALQLGRPTLRAEVLVNRFALTSREVEVLRAMAEGLRNTEVGRRLGISRRTVDRHVENILRKMDVRGRVDAVVLGVQEGLVGRSEREAAG